MFNKLEGTQVGGSVASYDGSGFVRDLDSKNRTEYLQVMGRHRHLLHRHSRHLHLTSSSPPPPIPLQTLSQLMEYSWVDRQTRAVIVSLNLYNGNFDYYCQSTFMLEFSPGGTVVPRATLKLLSTDIYTEDYFLGWNLVKSVPEMCVVLRLEQQGAARRPHAHSSPHPFPSQVRVLRRAAVHHGLPLPDVPHQARDEDVQAALQRLLEHIGHDALLGTTSGRVPDIQGAAHTHTHTRRPHTALSHPAPPSLATQLTAVALMLRILFLFNGARNEFRIWNPDYQELGAMYSLYSFPFVIDALTVLVFAFKSLKFFPLQKDLDMLAQTLFQAGGDLSVFVAMMIIILFGFTIMAINIFGTQSENFYLFVKAIGTLFLILLGEFDFEEMKAVDALW